MKQTFRQSMAWLHTWAGLLAGWVLFFVFLTGTFGYVNAEVDRWMRPEQPMPGPLPETSALLRLAERKLQADAPADAESWFVILPGTRGKPDLRIGWRSRPANGEAAGAVTSEVLEPRTGLPARTQARPTGGGMTLYAMHYQFHYLPYGVSIRIAGICAMFMLVAILSGIVTHKKIFTEVFTFRPGKGQRSWLDGHVLLAVSALAFHLMITWSGLIFFAYEYMPAGALAMYPQADARDRAFAEAYGVAPADSPGALRPTARLPTLTSLVAKTESELGAGKVSSVRIYNPGRDNARITLIGEIGVSRADTLLSVDASTGERLDDAPYSPPGKFSSVMLGLHEGRFAGSVLRLFYVLAGLAGTTMIATGLLLWSAKRKAKLAKSDKPHLGMVAVDVLNLGTIVGLPIGIAAYFWANRLLPVGMDGRAGWEVHTMFITWGLTYIVAIWRSHKHAWTELCWLAAGAWGLIPIVNAATTTRGLVPSLMARDWVFVGFDLSTLAAGLFFALVARRTASKAKAQAPRLPTPIEATA